MLLVLAPLLNPLVKQVDFLFAERKLGFGRWHYVNGVITMDSPMNLRILHASRGKPNHAFVVFRGLLERIQAKVRFLILRIRSMTLEALVRKDRPDLPVEINF